MSKIMTVAHVNALHGPEAARHFRWEMQYKYGILPLKERMPRDARGRAIMLPEPKLKLVVSPDLTPSRPSLIRRFGGAIKSLGITLAMIMAAPFMMEKVHEESDDTPERVEKPALHGV